MAHDQHQHAEHHDAAHTGDDAHGHGVGHVVPIKLLVTVGIALLILTWITVAATYVDLGEANIYIALAIAVVKASLVALFFMHLRWDRPFNGFVFVASVAFVALFIGGALTDTREYAPQVEQYRITELQGGDAKQAQDALTQTAQTVAEQAASNNAGNPEQAGDDQH